MEVTRPNPDELLERLKREEAQAARGKLKVFFGASAGVGKTFAMLAAAQRARAEGRDVVVGVVETHGRAETAGLLAGLELLAPREFARQGHVAREFDIDAALSRKPSLVLVDELAHTNAPGSRHPKRWQDIEELLANGIDVWTTLNVQHLESLNEVVGGITGITVWETVPDTFFDQADDVVLVDIPADELLARLKEGKVYLPEQADRAARNFFRKGNLLALRELALRRTADVVEEGVQEYRSDKSIDAVWKTQARLLCCIGPEGGAEQVVRSAARLGVQLGVEWNAVYVETPRLQRLPPAERERILRVVALAEELGATTAILTGNDAVATLVAYARSENIGTVVVGRGRGSMPWRRSVSDAIAAADDNLDVVEIGRGGKGASAPVTARELPDTGPDAKARERQSRYGWSLAACALATGTAFVLHQWFDLANIVMLFLLAVVLVGVRLGRGPAILAALVNVVAFDFFFVPPRFSFAVSDAQYLLTFAVMLAVGLLTGQLAAGARFQANVAGHRENRARMLYEFARELSGLLTTAQVVGKAESFMARAFKARVFVLVPDPKGLLRCLGSTPLGNPVDVATAQWTFDNAHASGAATDTLPGNEFLFIPLRAPSRTRGVLAIRPERARDLIIPEQRRQYDTFAALVGIALERVHYVEVARDALVKIEGERLRNSLLAALSHDLRTPLAALLGLAESLPLTRPALSAEQADVARGMAAQTRRLIALVNNLLDMARIQAGEVRLKRDWHSLEEIAGSAIRSLQPALAQHRVVADLPAELPLVEVDAVLLERVLVNLLENAAKYTPAGTTVTLSARPAGGMLEVDFADDGPGLPRGREEEVFEKFARGSAESATPGMGLGLAICRAIVEAHGGTIRADPGHAPGARFVIRLPLGTPPEMEPG